MRLLIVTLPRLSKEILVLFVFINNPLCEIVTILRATKLRGMTILWITIDSMNATNGQNIVRIHINTVG